MSIMKRSIKLLASEQTNSSKPIAKRLEIKNVIATKVEFKNNKCYEFIPPSALGREELVQS